MQAVVACPACRSGLVARRGDALCPSCVKAARELASPPLWLLDSPLLRQALAEVNLPAVPAIVRAACGLSQRDMAAVVGWSGAALSYYERGQRDGMFDIRSLLLFADAVGMPRAALLPLVLARPDAGLAGGTGGAAGTGLSWQRSGGTAAAGSDAYLASASMPLRAGDSHLRYWRACADILHARGHEIGGPVLLSAALQLWQRVWLAVRERGRGAADGQLLVAAGEVALCAGWIALDSGRPLLARPLIGEARKLAARAADPVLAVRALAEESALRAELAAGSRDSARRALRLAPEAQEEGRYLPMPRLQALIALRHAGAVALLSDKGAFQNAITRARRELERGGRHDEDSPGWLRFISESEITAAEARGYLNLGEAGRSVLLYRQLLASGLNVRDRARCGAGLASALLMQGALDDAVSAATEILPLLETHIAPLTCLEHLRAVRHAAAGAAGAGQFRDRFDMIERAHADSPDVQAGIPPQATASVPALSPRAKPHPASAQCPCFLLRPPAARARRSASRDTSGHSSRAVSALLDVPDEGLPRCCAES